MKNAIFLCAAFLAAEQARPQMCGPNAPLTFSTTTISGSNATWSDVEYTDASDDKYASFGNIAGPAGSFTDYMAITNFGFSIPSGTVIYGIVATVERSDPNGLTSDYSVRIIKNGQIGASERSTGTPYPLSDADKVYGSNSDLWGEIWSYKDVSNADFGIAIAAQRNATGGTTMGQVDYVRITVYYGYITLPLSLESFNAQKENKSVQVTWKTSSEINIDRFVVERSADGRSYSALTSVAASNQPSASYAYRDNSPLAGRSYYRLRIAENSGTDKYSKISAISFDKTMLAELFPSPWSPGKDLSVSNPVSEELTIKFFDNSGQFLGKTTTRSTKVVLPIQMMPNEVVYYKVFDKESHLKGSGTLVIN